MTRGPTAGLARALAVIAGLLLLRAAPAMAEPDPAPLAVQALRTAGAPSHQLPWVTGGKPRVAVRIHRQLYESLAVQSPPPAEPAALARWARRELRPDAVGGLRSLAFRVLRNDGRLLVLHLTGDACGAYCEPIDQQRVFDAETGAALEAADFFSADGRRQLERAQTKQLLREAAARLRDVRRHPRLQDDPEAYERCLARWRSSPPGLWSLELGGDGLWRFVGGGCSAHVNRASDRLDRFERPADLDALRPLLTPYGRWLLLGERRPPA